MKKVDTNNGVWVNDDPATLTNGTPIDADVMNNIQDEISNVITDNGGTLDGTNHSQLSQTLNKNFAKLNSPTLTGIPLTSNPDGTINNQIATVDYVNQKALQATVGFTPVQQSGGDNQGANKVYVGADKTDSNQVRVQIDQTDLGKIVFQQEDDKTYGVSKIGYDHVKGELAYYDTGNKAWHYSYTTDYIDGKAYISSLPDGNNLKVSDIIWNSSSSLPALYYGTDNSVAYLATETWANTTFQPVGDYATLTQAQTFTADQTIQNSNLHIVSGSLLLANSSGDDVALYTNPTNESFSGNELAIRTNSGDSSVYTVVQRTGNIYSSVFGDAAFEGRQNNFQQEQTIKTPNDGGTPLRLLSNNGLRGFEFGVTGNSTTSGAFLDFHCQPNDGSAQDYDGRMIVYGGTKNSPAGATIDFEAAGLTWNGYQVARVHNDFDWGPINGGYYSRVGNVITQSFSTSGNNAAWIILPIALANTNYQVYIESFRNSGSYHATGYASKQTGQFQLALGWLNSSYSNVGDEGAVIPLDVIVVGVL